MHQRLGSGRPGDVDPILVPLELVALDVQAGSCLVQAIINVVQELISTDCSAGLVVPGGACIVVERRVGDGEAAHRNLDGRVAAIAHIGVAELAGAGCAADSERAPVTRGGCGGRAVVVGIAAVGVIFQRG